VRAVWRWCSITMSTTIMHHRNIRTKVWTMQILARQAKVNNRR
jgi:hypothetical protein